MNTKNLTLINIALIIAVLILFYLQFSTNSSDSNKETSTEIENEELVATDIPNSTSSLQAANESASSFDFSTLKIAYVNSDTVSTYYSFAKDVQSSLLKKQKSAENQVKNKYKDYQKMVDDYQQSAKIMGQSEAEEKAQRIGLLEKEIMQLEQTLNQKLSNEELQITTNYITKTNTYMQKIGKQLGYDYVMSYRLGGPMLYANTDLDITREVIELLNIEYNSK